MAMTQQLGCAERMRGKSANLLSIGAVDFGIIVDSSVIIVENIYRHISTGENSQRSLKERILLACTEVERPLLAHVLEHAVALASGRAGHHESKP